jgi:hypothetical protein
MRDGSDPNLFRFNMAINDSYSSGSATGTLPRATFSRSMSANTHGGSFGRSTDSQLSPGTHTRGRARSGSLVTVTEVGGDEPHTINDRLGVGANFNAAWVNSPGK